MRFQMDLAGGAALYPCQAQHLACSCSVNIGVRNCQKDTNKPGTELTGGGVGGGQWFLSDSLSLMSPVPLGSWSK